MAKLAWISLVSVTALVCAVSIPNEPAGSTCAAAGCADAPPELLRPVANRTCLVTGISGMIGSYIARELRSRGCAVHGIVRFRTHYGNLAGLLSGEVTLHRGDITDSAFVRRVLGALRPDFIFHFAAQSLNGVSTDSPYLSMQVNIVGTLNILEAAKDLGLLDTRIFNAGSSTVYGKTSDEWDGPLPEDAPLQPVTPYGVSKVAQEMLGLQYFHAHGLHVVTGRFFQQVASGGPETLAVQDFAMQIALVEHGVRRDAVLVHGNLDTWRDMTDVRDSSRVMVQLAETSAPGKVYNVCSNRAIKVSELLATLLSLSPMGGNITLQQDPARLRAFDEKVLLGDNIYVCMHVCMYVCLSVCLSVCMHACMYVCIRTYVRLYVYIPICIRMYVWTYGMYICMY